MKQILRIGTLHILRDNKHVMFDNIITLRIIITIIIITRVPLNINYLYANLV